MKYSYYEDVHQKTEPEIITFDVVNFLLKSIDKVCSRNIKLTNGNKGIIITWKNGDRIPTIVIDEGVKAC
jgi:hypothetical protein